MFRLTLLTASLCCCAAYAAVPEDVARQLEENAESAREAMAFCRRYAHGWLSHADPETGLLPRNLTTDPVWNAKDAAADNYPFLALTAQITGLYHLNRAALHILEQERQLTNRLGALPDTYDFRTQDFLTQETTLEESVFGASEYVKDGLMPIVEWIGPSPWLDRMQELVHALYDETERVLSPGALPSENVEVCGELMQSMSRLYWRTGDAWYRERCFHLADRYLLETPVTGFKSIRLRDHGCEIIGGLSEVYVIAAREDADRHERYRPAIHALLDVILEKGVNEDGMMPDNFNPLTKEQDWRRISDGWGYVYNAFLTVAEVDGIARYRDAVVHALTNIHKYLGADWEGGSADGYADSVEGALNLLNRIPVTSAFEWVDQSMWHIFAKQRDDGVIEGWHGDGNSARTALMYALWKTQGVTVQPWRDDIQLGAAVDADGILHIHLKTDWLWRGTIRVDRPRHGEYLGLPLDYPRINQFPEWFIAAKEDHYTLTIDDNPPQIVDGESLWKLTLELAPKQAVHLSIAPVSGTLPTRPVTDANFRSMRYTSGDAEAARAWQERLRSEQVRVLRLDERELLTTAKRPVQAEIREIRQEPLFERRDLVITISPNRNIPVILTLPSNKGAGPFPAVVCIHGHGSTRETVYDPDTVYHGFGKVLAESGIVTIAADVGQHELQHPEATLMGERIWDLIRCVDYLETLPEVDVKRIGCAGLSLGGEMAMWLGALDTRMRATVSSGFLTVMNQMERNHCMCWKEDGLRELADFPDIYAVIAPRALLCQIGDKEPLSQFNTVLAERAFAQAHHAYKNLGVPERANLIIHGGGHEMDMPSLVSFLQGHL